MLNKLLKITKATRAAPEPTTPAPIATALKESPIGEDWESKWKTSHEVVEGNGGNTDWHAWTAVVENEEKSFAPTVPMSLTPK